MPLAAAVKRQLGYKRQCKVEGAQWDVEYYEKIEETKSLLQEAKNRLADLREKRLAMQNERIALYAQGSK